MKQVLQFKLTLAAWCAAAFTVALADEPAKFKGTVHIAAHKVAMKAGQLYVIKVEGQGFSPRLQLDSGFLEGQGQDPKKLQIFQGHFTPERDQIYTIYVIPQVFGLLGKKGPFEYSLEVTPVKLSEKPFFEKKDELTQADPPYKQQFINRRHHKAYKVKLKADRFYVIDMMRQGTTNLDPYLHLEDPQGKMVASNDDGGEGLNARIVFRPQQDGEYRIIATHIFQSVGPFVVTVRGEKE